MGYLHEGDKRYLANNISIEEHNEIIEGSYLNIILGNTGIGKSVYITKDVLKHYHDKKEDVLIVCNRTALKTQFTADLKELYGEEVIAMVGKNENIEKEAIILDYIKVMSYQYLERKVLADDLDLSIYKHIFCDEAQYFNVDCFNNTTDLSYNVILDYYKNGGKLTLMTATGELIIKQLEKDGYRDDLNILDFNDSTKYECNWNDRLRIECTSHKHTKLLAAAPKDEKVLIFMNGKVEMQNLSRRLNEESLIANGHTLENLTEGERVDLLNKYKESKYVHSIWRYLGEEGIICDKSMLLRFNDINKMGIFDTRILIANSSMDNGVSLKLTSDNPDRRRLGTIIIKDSMCNLSTIQKIGRARQDVKDPNDITNVKITMSKSAIDRQLEKNYFELQMLEDFYNMDQQTFQEIYEESYVDKDGKPIAHIIKMIETKEKLGFCEIRVKKEFKVYDLFESYIRYNTDYLESLLEIYEDGEVDVASRNAEFLARFYGKKVHIASGDIREYYKNSIDVEYVNVFNSKNFDKSQKQLELEYNRNQLLPLTLKDYYEDGVIFAEDDKVEILRSKFDNVVSKSEFKFELKEDYGIENRNKPVSKTLINKSISDAGYKIVQKRKKIDKVQYKYWNLEVA